MLTATAYTLLARSLVNLAARWRELGRTAEAATIIPATALPVCDAALEVTMCLMVHWFRRSGGVAATGPA